MKRKRIPAAGLTTNMIVNMDGYALIKGNVGYIIFDTANNSIITMENEVSSMQIVNAMLENGNPIYESIRDLKNNKPINIVGQPSKPEEFPIKRYKISIKWSRETPLVMQVKKLKEVFPVVKAKSNQELLKIAQKYETWHFDTLYLDSEGIKEIQCLGKGSHLDIIIDVDELKEIF